MDNFRLVWQLGKEYWESFLTWGNDRKLLYHAEQDVLKIVINMYETGHTPTEKQTKILLRARDRLMLEGMPNSF